MNLAVRSSIASILADRFDTGRVDRRTFRDRQRIADEAALELGEFVPDTAFGVDKINDWLSRKIGPSEQYV